ncbi:MAG: putative integral rane protein [Actinomycetia bacterium]|nr:putative integral rane protein [Actinomycetes bacterium]
MRIDGSPTAIARRYLAVQAGAGALWWIAVFLADDVRRLTLGGWNPAVLVGPDLAFFVGGSAMAAFTGGRRWAAATAAWTIAITIALTTYALAERNAGWGALLMAPAAIGTVGAATVLRLGHLPVRWFFIGPFAFRPAPARSAASHLRHSLTQLVVFWTSFLVLLPLAIAWGEGRLRLDQAGLDRHPWPGVGIATFVLGSCVGLWSCVSMAIVGEGTPLPAATGRRLVVVGPYRWVRNPMAVAGAVQTIGAGLVLGSWLVVASAVLGGLIWNTFIRPREEADLARRFGDDYERYRARVACWVPRSRWRRSVSPPS